MYEEIVLGEKRELSESFLFLPLAQNLLTEEEDPFGNRLMMAKQSFWRQLQL
jgi:hypothetical protein